LSEKSTIKNQFLSCCNRRYSIIAVSSNYLIPSYPRTALRAAERLKMRLRDSAIKSGHSRIWTKINNRDLLASCSIFFSSFLRNVADLLQDKIRDDITENENQNYRFGVPKRTSAHLSNRQYVKDDVISFYLVRTNKSLISHVHCLKRAADIFGSNNLRKRGNVLFDSGAQVSLIRQETADSIGLKGKKISVTITKVGGQKEEINTNVYNVPVSAIDNRRTYSVKAIGIPVISSESGSIDTGSNMEQLGLPGERIRRNKGPIDLLIGIDHAQLAQRSKRITSLQENPH
ncbi:PREDICTED: uncharacterized protein LOC107346959, partial [Paramuricea clavata]